MAALTATSVRQVSAGDLSLKIVKFTSVDDGDTYASGLGTNVVAFKYQVTADPTTNTSSGCNVAESSGTFTFYPGVDSLTGTLFIYHIGG
jgi:hypothetical protein